MKFMRQTAGWTSPPAPFQGIPFHGCSRVLRCVTDETFTRPQFTVCPDFSETRGNPGTGSFVDGTGTFDRTQIAKCRMSTKLPQTAELFAFSVSQSRGGARLTDYEPSNPRFAIAE
jgi:hypothetical protein